MASYLEMLEKIQSQTLDNLKQVQAVQVATLNTAKELVTSLPSMTSLTSSSNVPTIEGLPTLQQIADLNTSFATKLLDQQKAFASQIAELFTPAPKTSAN